MRWPRACTTRHQGTSGGHFLSASPTARAVPTGLPSAFAILPDMVYCQTW